MRSGLRMLLEAQPDLEIVGEAETGAGALAKVAALRPAVYEELTQRETEVLTLIAQGLTNPEIAEQLVISVKTVDRHRENIMRKLNLHSRVESVKYAIRTGLIEVDE